MAAPKLNNQLLITLGNGADPEVFAHPCGANTRSFQLTNNLGEDVVLDCDDPLGTSAIIVRWTESTDSQISISGRVALSSWPTWRAWFDSGAIKNVQVEVANTVAAGGGYYLMPALLQDMEIGAEGTGTMSFSVTIVQAGTRQWLDAA